MFLNSCVISIHITMHIYIYIYIVTGSSIVIVYVLSKTRTLVVWIKYSIFINSQGSERYNY